MKGRNVCNMPTSTDMRYLLLEDRLHEVRVTLKLYEEGSLLFPVDRSFLGWQLQHITVHPVPDEFVTFCQGKRHALTQEVVIRNP